MTDKNLYIEKGAGLSFQVSNIKEEIKTESDKTGMLIVRNIPCTVLNEKNANGRIYSTSTMQEALKENSNKGLYESRSLLCTGDDHPDTTYPKPTHASHVVIGNNIVQEGGKDILLNDWLILPTVEGKNLKGLIESGVTVGTSIRGLGKQNENTNEIEDYEYLGTDVVGNPSAGTYANFSKLNESIIVESITLTESVNELDKLNITENNNNKSNEEQEMSFDLEQAIQAFNTKYEDKEVTSESISDLLKIEMQVLENNSDTEAFEEFKESVLGKLPTKEEVKEATSQKAESAKDEDTLNKAQRHLEASEVLATQLKEQNEDLLEEVQALRKYKESSGKLIAELTNRVKIALEDVKQRESSIEESEESIVSSMKEAATQMAKDLQAEAKEAILNLETRLEHTIQMGDLISKYFFASKAINEALVERIKKQQEVKEEVVNSKVAKVTQKIESRKEPTRHGWK